LANFNLIAKSIAGLENKILRLLFLTSLNRFYWLLLYFLINLKKFEGNIHSLQIIRSLFLKKFTTYFYISSNTRRNIKRMGAFYWWKSTLV